MSDCDVPRTCYSFPLRRDVTLSLLLPTDLTERDAERLCRWLRALAMPDQTVTTTTIEIKD